MTAHLNAALESKDQNEDAKAKPDNLNPNGTTLATVPSRRYRRRQAYEYRQVLMYLSMVIWGMTKYITGLSGLTGAIVKCQHHRPLII